MQEEAVILQTAHSWTALTSFADTEFQPLSSASANTFLSIGIRMFSGSKTPPYGAIEQLGAWKKLREFFLTAPICVIEPRMWCR